MPKNSRTSPTVSRLQFGAYSFDAYAFYIRGPRVLTHRTQSTQWLPQLPQDVRLRHLPCLMPSVKTLQHPL
jgi:hypothetical protein